jgi:alpha-tubulin suppressor-like RCC1 family protein
MKTIRRLYRTRLKSVFQGTSPHNQGLQAHRPKFLSLLRGVFAASLLSLALSLGEHASAQTLLDPAGKFRCDCAAIVRISGNSAKVVNSKKTIAAQTATISRLTTSLSAATSKKAKAKIAKQLKAAKALLAKFKSCTRGTLTPTGALDVVTPLALGVSHACAITPSPEGAVYCWGRNNWGQLGNGSTTDSSVPVKVSGLSRVVAVSAGENHSCALLECGTVKCWGANNFGQFGKSTPASASRPVSISNISGGSQIATGYDHTCVLKSSGGLTCFGRNDSGECGVGSTDSVVAPSTPTGLGSSVASFANGAFHTCAVSSGGALSCFGWNNDGQLGINSFTESTTAAPVSGLTSGVSRVAGSYFSTCALLGDGNVQCWGRNNLSQLARATPSFSSTPLAATGVPVGAAQLVMSNNNGCVLSTAGAVFCWGTNSKGQLGDGSSSSTTASTAVQVQNLSATATFIAAKSLSACAVLSSGAVQCWGDNTYGQAGNGTTNENGEFSPVTVSGFTSAQ